VLLRRMKKSESDNTPLANLTKEADWRNLHAGEDSVATARDLQWVDWRLCYCLIGNVDVA
jgi:hypothetical protein